jgi:hypothetical protein
MRSPVHPAMRLQMVSGLPLMQPDFAGRWGPCFYRDFGLSPTPVAASARIGLSYVPETSKRNHIAPMVDTLASAARRTSCRGDNKSQRVERGQRRNRWMLDKTGS